MGKLSSNISVDKTVEIILDGCADYVYHIDNHLNRNKAINAHKSVELFQKDLTDYLKQKTNMPWEVEKGQSKIAVKDSVDVFCDYGDSTWILEIDALRHDQIAAKFLSRIALWGDNKKPVNYVAILYPRSGSDSKNVAIKYLHYMHVVAERFNAKVSGIIFEKVNNSFNVELYEPSKHPIFDIVAAGKNPARVVSMTKALEAVVKNNLNNSQLIASLQGKKIIKNDSGSRAKPIVINGVDLFLETQWRRHGTQSNWDDFVEVCKRNGIKISEAPSKVKTVCLVKE